jgi:hypothetical protein
MPFRKLSLEVVADLFGQALALLPGNCLIGFPNYYKKRVFFLASQTGIIIMVD